MIESENINEFIFNMKLKKNILRGISEKSVYENMRQLTDLYEEKINELNIKISELEKLSENLEKELLETKIMYQKDAVEIKAEYRKKIEDNKKLLVDLAEACEILTDKITNKQHEHKMGE